MIRVALLNFPAGSAESVAAHLAQTPPVPDFMTLHGPLVKGSTEDGIKTMSFYRFDDSKLKEAADYMERRYAIYRSIPGVEVAIEEWVDADVALQLLDESESLDMALEMFSVHF